MTKKEPKSKPMTVAAKKAAMDILIVLDDKEQALQKQIAEMHKKVDALIKEQMNASKILGVGIKSRGEDLYTPVLYKKRVFQLSCCNGVFTQPDEYSTVITKINTP